MIKKIPKYMILVNWIKEQIENKVLKPGDKLYSENELSGMFGMSRQTVRHAIDVLEKDDIIESRQGSGTYIKEKIARSKNTMNIAVITTYVDDYIFPTIIKEIEKVLSKSGYIMQIAFTHNRVDKELAALKNFLNRDMVDGIIIEPTKSGIPNPNLALYDEIMKRNIPVIFMNSYYPGINIPHVSMNDREAGYKAVNYLINAGHTKIAGMFKADDFQGHLRYAGYTKGLLEAGLRIHDEHVLWYDTEDISNVDNDATRILKRIEGCTACVCYNDQIAVKIVGLCQKHGIKIPEDLSITSIDNSNLAALCEVPLTSVELPMKLLGNTLAQNMIKLIQDSNYEATVEFNPTINVRNSVKEIV